MVLDQARTIIRWVDQLPDEVDADLRAKAEAHLLEQAKHHDARALNQLGKHLFEVIAPDEADAREATILEAEEKPQPGQCYLKVYDDGHGRPAAGSPSRPSHGAALRKMLLALTAPKHRAATKAPASSHGRPRKPWGTRSAS